MINILKVDINRLLKSKVYYVICGLLGIYTAIQIYFNFFYHGGSSYGVKGASTLISFMQQPTTIIILFAVLTGRFILEEYSNGAIKNILGRGISRTNYFFSKIIATYLVAIVTSILFVVVQVVISILSARFGMIEHPEYLILGIILDMIYLLAIITIVIGTTAITRSGIIIFVVFIMTINIFKIIMLISSIVHVHMKINLIWFDISTYVGKIGYNNIIPIKGIITAVVYIIIFLAIGVYGIKKQDVR